MRVAINLQDIQRISTINRIVLFQGRINLDKPLPIRWDGRIEIAVEFTCDELYALCYAEQLRFIDRKAGRVPTRVYVMRDKAWLRVYGNTPLVELKDGKVTVYHEIVPPPPVEYVPPPVVKLV